MLGLCECGVGSEGRALEIIVKCSVSEVLPLASVFLECMCVCVCMYTSVVRKA